MGLKESTLVPSVHLAHCTKCVPMHDSIWFLQQSSWVNSNTTLILQTRTMRARETSDSPNSYSQCMPRCLKSVLRCCAVCGSSPRGQPVTQITESIHHPEASLYLNHLAGFLEAFNELILQLSKTPVQTLSTRYCAIIYLLSQTSFLGKAILPRELNPTLSNWRK